MKILGRLRNQKRGFVIVMTAAMLAALVGLTALVVDLGLLYATRVKLTNLADAAALAGVQELPRNNGAAYASASEYAQLNGKTGDRVDIRVLNGTTVAVKATRTVPLMFAGIFGLATCDVSGAAAARVNPVSRLTGTVPFGLVRQTLVYGQVYTIKIGSGTASGNYHGNFGALALGGTGASVFRDNIKYGSDVSIQVGDWVTTETGNMVGPTKQGISYRYTRTRRDF
jgi:Flp pilus assembly protein TadG